MADLPLLVPGIVRHSKGARSDGDRTKEVRAHYDGAPGLRFLADVLVAIHARPEPIRTAQQFYAKFPAKVSMAALESRPDLRARIIQALTGGPPSLTRRLSHDVMTAQIELLIENDLPEDERSVRAADDRGRTVVELYLKYLDPVDLVAYLPAGDLWAYERDDAWWEKATDSTRRLMAAEIKSIRRHAILSDTELLDRLGNETLERDLPVSVRARIRAASRAAAVESRPFRDTDVFDCVRTSDGARDLVDDLVAHVALPHLRLMIERAAEVIGLVEVKPPPAAPAPEPVAHAEAQEDTPRPSSATGEAPARRASLMESLAPPSGRNGARGEDVDDDAFS
jgi:hypothetical protein